MAKVTYNNLSFDSELEVEYYKYLKQGQKKGLIIDFIYHPLQIPNLVGKRSYTPDFAVLYNDRAEIIETKGYNPYSKMIDDAIHQAMLSKSEEYLQQYLLAVIVKENETRTITDFNKWISAGIKGHTIYKKIKYLKAYGFVDWDFKNPNTLANKRKEKIENQKNEIADLKAFKKDTERFYRYYVKIENNGKLTKSQAEWYNAHIEKIKKEYS